MTREILFRGKRVDNGQWVEGYYVKDPKGLSRIYYKPFDESSSNTYHFVIPESVGQFTGLTDKNGNKIFEGDLICVCDNKNGFLKVEFKNQYVGGWVLTHPEVIHELSLGARKVSDLEVIGNIHDK